MNKTSKILEFLMLVMEWADPWYWILSAAILFVLFTIHWFPLELDSDNHNITDRLLLWLRRVCIFLFVCVTVSGPALFYAAMLGASGPNKEVAKGLILDWYWDMLLPWALLVPVSSLSGIGFNLAWHRYGEPWFSNLLRRFRVNQETEELSDVRIEIQKYPKKVFNPEKYFKDGYYFLGLDEDDKPIYVEATAYEEVHKLKLARTGDGKGVAAGVLVTQTVRRGNSCFYVDPKKDGRIPFIMQREAERAGKPFIYLDLNPEGKGHWECFKGSTLRNRRARMVRMFKIQGSSTDSDVYQSKERKLVDILLQRTDGSLRAMLDAIREISKDDDLSKLRDGLEELAQISTFMPPKKKKGHSIEQSLVNGAVVYIAGSLTDSVVKQAMVCYISELLQEAGRLRSPSERPCHLSVFVDETRFAMCKEIADALATARELRVDMTLLTQAITDFKNVEDTTLDGDALIASVKINCKIKSIYAAADTETAEWAESMTGTKWIKVPRNEKVKVNRLGGEVWENSRVIETKEVPYYSQNVFKSLPPMVSVCFVPGVLPRVAFSHWLDVDTSNPSWEKADKDEVVADSPKVVTPAIPPASPKQQQAPAPTMRQQAIDKAVAAAKARAERPLEAAVTVPVKETDE